MVRPGWYLDGEKWRANADAGLNMFKVPVKRDDGEETLAELLARLGPAVDAEVGTEATMQRLEEVTFDFSFG